VRTKIITSVRLEILFLRDTTLCRWVYITWRFQEPQSTAIPRNVEKYTHDHTASHTRGAETIYCRVYWPRHSPVSFARWSQSMLIHIICRRYSLMHSAH